MKNTLLMFIVGLCFVGCSSSGPSITGTSVSDDTPVSGQKILLQVYSIADKYPMTHSWTASGGQFDEWDDTQYWAYWTAPDEEGEHTITCAVRDKDDDEESYTFTVVVSPRALEDSLVDGTVLSLLKQGGTIGGVWASTDDENAYIRYLSSTSNEDTSWQGAFSAMDVILDPYYFTYTLFGAPHQGLDITVLAEGRDPATLTCETCDEADVINDLAIDVYDPDVMWVGTGSGLHWYDSSPLVGEDAWVTYKTERTSDLYQGVSYTYAATELGVYELDGEDDEPLFPGDSCAVIEVENDDETVSVWHITGSQVCENGVALPVQPAAVACSLDADWNNTIWCGKYWWDGVAWQTPQGLEDYDIVESVVSAEGLVYFLTASGRLLRW